METNAAFILVMTSVPARELGERLAAELVTQRLAACVNITGNCRSLYFWNDQLETADEHLLLIKTRDTLYQAVEAAIQSFHPYECPEIIALPIIKGARGYLEWLNTTTEEL